jgi:hypothetical protein
MELAKNGSFDQVARSKNWTSKHLVSEFPGMRNDRLQLIFSKALLAFLLVTVVAAQARAERQTDRRLSFNRDVRPILSNSCFACHGPDEGQRAADLRLDDRQSSVNDLAVISPGEPESSEMIRRILSEDEAEAMPPPDSHVASLSLEQREILIRWIREGAEYETHWAFVPPERGELPEVKSDDWVREPIDAFVLAALESKGWEPSPEANRSALIRRLKQDLTGLPPTAAEVEAFVSDTDPNSYSLWVDRFLDSQHFGERMALVWLDAARYADTNGFSIDGGRQMWLWRDWVIDAFNRNLPYDQFLLEQLAGDLLPEPTDAQMIATGFQRNNMVTHEGGTIPEENLVNYNADRVKTLGEAVMGLTLGCAQCHDHKYDPISQRDYYQIFAYFNTLSDRGLDGDGGRNPAPGFEARTVLSTDELSEIESELTRLREELANPSPQSLARWEAEQSALLANRGKNFRVYPAKALKISTPNAGEGFEIEQQQFAVISKPGSLVAYDVSLELPQLDTAISGIRARFIPIQDSPGGDLGFGRLAGVDGEASADSPKTFMLTALSASSDQVPSDQVNLTKLLKFRSVTASSWREGHRPELVKDTRNSNGWVPQNIPGQPEVITATFEKPISPSATPYMTVQLNFGHGKQLVAGRFEFLVMTGIDDGSSLPEEVIAAIQTPLPERSSHQRELLQNYYAAHGDGSWALRVAIANLEERRAVLTEKFPTMVMNIAEKPRETFVLARGDYSQPTERVQAGIPRVLPDMPQDAPSNRLGLARWLVQPDHPLTARVAVNRIWQMLFGNGLVRTAADFGTQGEYPTHPELLDWLALEFVDSGWDTKELVRRIVHSATYRQSSVATEDSLSEDTNNRFLSRGPRFRLPAEFVRDGALQVSGLLVPRVGGPSVNPYMPGDLWREVSHYGSTPATAQTFVQDHGEKLYRRSMYTYWKRTMPPPNMAAFDAPNRETCVVQRADTNTPLQALVLLNDVQFVEASRAFAERILAHSSDDLRRLQWAWKECLSRAPSEKELAIASGALARERQRFAGDPQAAIEYLANGESKRDETIAPTEHAAWAQVSALLLNLSETVTRN